MGTRLYPNTKNVAVLEKLIGVPAGTAAKLDELEKRIDRNNVQSFSERMKKDDEFYAELFADGNEAVDRYNNFMTFGWGKFRAMDSTGEDLAPGYAGSLTDLDKVRRLFEINRIEADPAECEGVHWC